MALSDVSSGEWKDSVLLVFEYFCERTPRSFVEQRDTSVVWNYKYAGEAGSERGTQPGSQLGRAGRALSLRHCKRAGELADRRACGLAQDPSSALLPANPPAASSTGVRAAHA